MTTKSNQSAAPRMSDDAVKAKTGKSDDENFLGPGTRPTARLAHRVKVAGGPGPCQNRLR